jgi:hypothetical protein
VFFKIADTRTSLPEKCPTHIVDSFLAILVSLISLQKDSTVTIRSVTLLFSYLKNGKTSVSLNTVIDP